MTDFYKNTRACIDEYNAIVNKIYRSTEETTDEEDEKLQNHCLYLAHALIRDVPDVGDIKTVAKIILDTVK